MPVTGRASMTLALVAIFVHFANGTKFSECGGTFACADK